MRVTAALFDDDHLLFPFTTLVTILFNIDGFFLTLPFHFTHLTAPLVHLPRSFSSPPSLSLLSAQDTPFCLILIQVEISTPFLGKVLLCLQFGDSFTFTMAGENDT